MSAAKTGVRRKVSPITLISSLFLVATIIWATWSVINIQAGVVRLENPHEPYPPDEWEINVNFNDWTSNWFENVTYQDLPLNMTLPDNLLEQLENVLFIVDPYDPPQLWRSTAYDRYDGSRWAKTQLDTGPLDNTELITRAQAVTQGNAIYTILINVSAGGATGSVELPALFPQIQVIQDSFQSHPNGLLLQYTLETDNYNTLLFNPLIEGESDEYVLISYEVTYRQQDLTNVANNALPGILAPSDVNIYKDLDDVQPLSQRVQDNASQFVGAADNAYEMAVLVDAYFRDTFELMLDDYQERPESGREVTDWFIERGGGLPMDFATAYCVYMRYLNIPARMTIGYAVGDQEETHRVVRVRHMMFWAEVFIPMSSGGGEWIQVVPIPLPDNMGGGDIPENVGEGDLQVIVWPNLAEPWALLGDPFDLSAVLLLQGLPTGEGATIRFRDETAFLHLGTVTIVQGTLLPLANFTYAFPMDADLGLHNISATYDPGAFSVTNFTYVFAVAQPEPLGGGRFSLSETIDVDLKLGWDNYTSVWADTVHAHGLMTVGGEPVDGTTLINDQIQIMWDETWIGNATIQADGTYQHDILVGVTDPRMSTGMHEVWSSYAGEYRQGFPYLLPSRSADNSTVDVWGKTSFTLNVIPSPVFRGASITYDGQVELLDGTPLVGEDIGLFFDGNFLFNATTNSTGGFNAPYTIPASYPPGIYNAQANWSSTIDHVLGNWSAIVPIQVTIQGAELTIDSVPQPPAENLHVWENITIFGQLYDPINSSGLANEWVDIYWQNSNGTHLLGPVLTNATGHYELDYTAVPSDIGTATYWSKWEGSLNPNYLNATSSSMTITVKKWDVAVSIAVNPTTLHPLETTRIQGLVYLPEYLPTLALLPNAPVRIWWTNYSGDFNITDVITNSTGGYVFDYEVPFSHPDEVVTVWAQFVETSAFAGANSSTVSVTIERLSSIISVYSNATHYHLDEVVHIWGRLQNGSDGSPFADMTIQIYWDNGIQYLFNATTNSTGWYDFYYNLTLSDPTSTVAVWVEWNSTIPTQSNASATLMPSLTVQLYQVTLTGTPDSDFHFLDEVIVFSGTLTFDVNGTPLAGEIITIYYVSSLGTSTYQKTTNSTGGYRFLYNLSLSDTAEDIQMWAIYTSMNSYVENDTSATETVTLSLYLVTLDVSFDLNPVYLNETVVITVHLYFSHNSTGISGAEVSLNWDSSTAPRWLTNVTTDGTGHASYPYSGMSGDVDLSVQVYGIYDGTQLIEGVESTHEPLTLQRWATTIIGFSTGGITIFYLTETVVATGTLEHGSSVPFGGVIVEMLVVGVGVVDTYTTASDGSFTCSWTIPQSTIPGSYDVTVRYLSSVNWIDNHTAIPITIDIDAYTLVWVPFDAAPDPVYISENLNISGVLSLDNGTPYGFATVDIWGRHSVDFVDFFIASLITDGSGRFWVVVQIGEAVPVGILQVWANCTPADSYISSGQSPIIPVQVQQIPVNLTANASTSLVYRGASVTISGTLTFANGTPMVGYVVDIMLGGVSVDNVTITDGVAGSFSVDYFTSWIHPLGPSNIYAQFSSPTPAIENAQTAPESLEIWDSVELHMNAQSVTALILGESLMVTGYVSNVGGIAPGITLEILVDGSRILTATSQSDGNFSRTWTNTSAYSSGDYVLSLANVPGYYDVVSNVDTWIITLFTQSVLQVRFDPSTPPDIMPGESYSFIIRLTDNLENAIPGAVVTIYLDTLLESTSIGVTAITNSSEHRFSSTLPVSWDTSGYYTIRVEYSGTSGVLASSAETSETMHIFTDNVNFDMSGTLAMVAPSQVFTFNGLLVDENGDPIVGRSIEIAVNFTTTRTPTTTGPDGTFTATVTVPAEEGAFTYRVIITSSETTDVRSGQYTVNIAGPGEIPAGMMLIMWILVISVEGIIALLVVARYRQSYTRFFRSYKPGFRFNTSFNHHKGKRW